MHTAFGLMGGSYPDARDGVNFGMGTLGALAYVPDLQPVGSGSQGTYYPRSTEADADALEYLGFYPNRDSHDGTTGSQRGDMANTSGAWDPTFQAAVRAFQASRGLAADGWIGPTTRQHLAIAVAAKNASDPLPSPNPLPPPMPIPIPPNVLPVPPPMPPSPNVLPAPAPRPPPNVQPASASSGKMSTTTMAAIGVGTVVVLGLGYALLSD